MIPGYGAMDVLVQGDMLRDITLRLP